MKTQAPLSLMGYITKYILWKKKKNETQVSFKIFIYKNKKLPNEIVMGKSMSQWGAVDLCNRQIDVCSAQNLHFYNIIQSYHMVYRL